MKIAESKFAPMSAAYKTNYLLISPHIRTYQKSINLLDIADIKIDYPVLSADCRAYPDRLLFKNMSILV